MRVCKSCKSRVMGKLSFNSIFFQLMCLLTRSTWPASCGPGNSWSICPSYFPLGNSCIEQEQKHEPKSLIHKAMSQSHGLLPLGHCMLCSILLPFRSTQCCVTVTQPQFHQKAVLYHQSIPITNSPSQFSIPPRYG